MNKSLLYQEINAVLKKMMSLNQSMSERAALVSQIEHDLFQKNCLELYELALKIKSAKNEEIIEAEKAPIHVEEPVIKAESLELEKQNEIILDSEEIKEIKEKEIIETAVAPLLHEMENPSPGFVPGNNLQSNSFENTDFPEFRRKQHDPPSFETIDTKIKNEDHQPKIAQENTSKSIHEVIQPKETGKTIHEILSSGKEENELHKLFPHSKITSISSAIDISKRFELQNNLFAGQSLNYSEAIKSLDNAQNKEEAFQTFDVLSSKYHWNQEDELVKELKSFIYRLF